MHFVALCRFKRSKLKYFETFGGCERGRLRERKKILEVVKIQLICIRFHNWRADNFSKDALILKCGKVTFDCFLAKQSVWF